MPRYFIEVSYKGTGYAGFQIQQNANTVQAEVEKALQIYFRQPFTLTGSSRTDAGVHALQNFFHCDTDSIDHPEKACYHLNAILPADIVMRSIKPVADDAHCRFDALSRSYIYALYQSKDPFLQDRAYYYPYQLDMPLLQQAANALLGEHNFESFAKKNIQAHTFDCTIYKSRWIQSTDSVIEFHITGNRFLRGMVRGLVGTMLHVGRRQLTIEGFTALINSKNAALADFSTPANGLKLASVNYL